MTPIWSPQPGERVVGNEDNVAGGGWWVIGHKGGGCTVTHWRGLDAWSLLPVKMFAKGKTCSNVGIHHLYLIPPTFSYQHFPQIVWLPQTPHYALDRDRNLEYDRAPFQFQCVRSYLSGPEILLWKCYHKQWVSWVWHWKHNKTNNQQMGLHATQSFCTANETLRVKR